MTKILGDRGELIAEKYLCGLGFLVVQRNYRAKQGELDLIVRKQGLFVFVEVKTRRSDCAWVGLESVGQGKKRKIRRMIQFYLATAAEAAWVEEMRFDVIFVTQERVANHVEGEFL